ncbi:MAG: class I adenylate-forming enzyme family protein [Exilibacterium sp.]
MCVYADFVNLVSKNPASPSVIMLNDSIDYASIFALSERIAGGLVEFGLVKGDRVAIHMLNRPEVIAICYACLKVGAVIVPISNKSSKDEIQKLLSHSRARFYFGDVELFEISAEIVNGSALIDAAWIIRLKENIDSAKSFDQVLCEKDLTPVKVGLDDPAAIFYTSGTTGLPKGVVYTYETLMHSLDLMDPTLDPEYRSLSARTDAVHSLVGATSAWGMLTFLASLRRGRPVALLTYSYDSAAVFALLHKHKIGWLGGAPSSFSALIAEYKNRKYDAIDLSGTICIAGGDTCQSNLPQAFLETFNANIQTTYGQTETCGPVIHHPNLNEITEPAIGWPLPGVEIRIDTIEGGAGEGELLVKSPAQPAGFWRGVDMEAFDSSGWLATGDIVLQRADGCLMFLGRKGDHYMVEGYPVVPLEVENTLLEHENVAAALVFSIVDDSKGARGIAIVEPREYPLPTQELKKHLNGRIADYKYPSEFYLVDCLPVGSNGKYTRKQLAQAYADSDAPFCKK